MMKDMMGFYDESQKAVQAGVSWAKIREATADIQHQLRSMKFEVISPYPLKSLPSTRSVVVTSRGVTADTRRW